jgi:hypothetical protein
MAEHRQYWVFKVTGGQDFDFQIKGNPIMKYRTPMSLLKAICTESQAETAAEILREQGCKVEFHTPSETEDQKVERKSVFAILGDGVTFPSVKCPECPWLDPHIEGFCGAGFAQQGKGWDKDAIRERLRVVEYRKAWKECPLLEDIMDAAEHDLDNHPMWSDEEE